MSVAKESRVKGERSKREICMSKRKEETELEDEVEAHVTPSIMIIQLPNG